MVKYKKFFYAFQNKEAEMAELKIRLDIPDVNILKSEYNRTNDLILTVESTKKSTFCRNCGKKINKVHGYGETILLRHLSILDQPVYIRIKPVRYICLTCDDNPTTTEQPDWYGRKSKFTKAYEEYLMRLLINSTILDVAKKEGLTFDDVEGALNRQVEQEVDWERFDKLKLLGIDEIALKKGHKDFVAVVSTRINNETKIIAILPDRKKNTVKSFLESMPERLKLTVKMLCTDLYDGYINALKEVFGSRVKVVVDRFHIAKKYRECADKLRKKELARLKAELSTDEYKKLKGAMWALRKKSKNLNEDEIIILENLFNYSPALKEAYELQTKLTEIFNTNYNKQQGEKEIKKWMKKVERSELTCFDNFLLTLRNYWNEILNYFHRKGRKNSGFVEGLNNKIKTLKRRCYGIFSTKSLYQRIRLDLDGYNIFARC